MFFYYLFQHHESINFSLLFILYVLSSIRPFSSTKKATFWTRKKLNNYIKSLKVPQKLPQIYTVIAYNLYRKGCPICSIYLRYLIIISWILIKLADFFKHNVICMNNFCNKHYVLIDLVKSSDFWSSRILVIQNKVKIHILQRDILKLC